MFLFFFFCLDQVCPDQPDLTATPAPPDRPDRKELRVRPELKEPRDPSDPKARLAFQVSWRTAGQDRVRTRTRSEF